MATAAEAIPLPKKGTIAAIDEITYHARLVTTTAGAVDTTNSWVPGGQTIVKTAATVGRYTLTLPKAYERLLNVIATPIGPATANYGANTTGLKFFIRDDDITRAVNLSTSDNSGTVELQFVQASYADAEIPDGLGFMLTIFVASGKTF